MISRPLVRSFLTLQTLLLVLVVSCGWWIVRMIYLYVQMFLNVPYDCYVQYKLKVLVYQLLQTSNHYHLDATSAFPVKDQSERECEACIKRRIKRQRKKEIVYKMRNEES
jgi:hypothetical protein